jgi:glycosyltransferase involved in cell wall biosynthesis
MNEKMTIQSQSVLIGIPVHTEPQRLRETLSSLASVPARVLLLADNPDEETDHALQELKDYPQLRTDLPQGTAACFNRLIHFGPAEFYLLLESGTIPAAGWLGRLLAAFQRFPQCGMAGPSTNLSWNEQRIVSSSDDSQNTIAAVARAAARRFGAACRSLQPLYSLGDFCYMVRREVIETIGDADEGYSTGPCWEMGYNIRAHRAGFSGLWVCGAYVHRSPATKRRMQNEAEHFQASKHRYQDKFCGLRLRGLKHDYRTYCRGDACPNFAPAELIAIRPLPPSQSRNAVSSSAVLSSESMSKAVSDMSSMPLVTCIMPTCNRREWIERSIHSFLTQDYLNRELLIVDDGTDAISDLLPPDSRIRYHRLDRRLTIGAKRNLACELAGGDLIAHWDDDDWYPAWRLSRQVEFIEQTLADICGSSELYYVDRVRNSAFRYAYSNGRPWVAGNTLLFRKSFWEGHRFPDVQIGEDAKFVWSANAQSVADLKEPGLCIASIHPGNTSPKLVHGAWWHAVPMASVQQLLEQLEQPNQAAAAAAKSSGKNPHAYSGDLMQSLDEQSRTHSGHRIAREADLQLTEFMAFNHGHNLPHMRRWELPWTLFAAQLGNTMAVLDCTINPVNFAERIAALYPDVRYKHISPVQQGSFRLPFGAPDESYDRVFCINTLEHLVREQREALIADLARKLKLGGQLLLTSDHYFDSSWQNPAFLNAGVMRADRAEFFGGWNKTTPEEWNSLCHPHGLTPVDAGPWELPAEGDAACYRNPAPFSHTVMAAAFSKGAAEKRRGRRIVLALLTWNTRDISIDSVKAYLREANMLRRLGCEPYLCVCDNGSADGTQAALQEIQQQTGIPCKLILNPENTGNSVARNQIIDYMLESDADYLLFMDGDIEVVPFSSFAMLRYMENCGHRLGCIGADSWGQTPQRHQASPCLYTLDGMRVEEVNLVAWTQYGMFRRAVFEQGVRFDENGPFTGPGWGFEDNDLAFQMELKGFRNQRFFGMVYLHRAAQSSIRIMRQLGLDPRALYARRKQYVIDKWASVPQINNGPLTLVRRVQM